MIVTLLKKARPDFIQVDCKGYSGVSDSGGPTSFRLWRGTMAENHRLSYTSATVKLIHYYEDGREELYNLAANSEKQNDQAKDHPEKVRQLSKMLFDYLHEVGAIFPENDPEYSAELERKYLEKIASDRLPDLEKQRTKFLSRDFSPRNQWWGSQIPKDWF